MLHNVGWSSAIAESLHLFILIKTNLCAAVKAISISDQSITDNSHSFTSPLSFKVTRATIHRDCRFFFLFFDSLIFLSAL